MIRFTDYNICVKRDFLKALYRPSPTVDPEQGFVLMSKEVVASMGPRLKQLRKQKGWTQKELATRVKIRFSQLNKYESGLHAPPLDKLVELAEVLETGVDYLLTGSRTDGVPLHNTRLLERFKALEGFDAEDREAVLKLIDAMIVKRRVEGALSSVER